MSKRYNKSVSLEYQHIDSDESQKVVDEMFNKLFTDMIQKRKQLIRYFASEEFKNEYKLLRKKKSLLVDFLSVH